MTRIMITLRKVQQSDLDTVYAWENNSELWAVSEQKGPFTMEEIKSFLEECVDESNMEISRWIICLHEKSIGAVDLFNLDMANGKCGLGIFISEVPFRNRGYATIALRLMITKLKDYGIRSVDAIIYDDNRPSIKLFLGTGFVPVQSLNFNEKKATRYTLSLTE